LRRESTRIGGGAALGGIEVAMAVSGLVARFDPRDRRLPPRRAALVLPSHGKRRWAAGAPTHRASNSVISG